jgi:predicted TPR repeat methyltransferase
MFRLLAQEVPAAQLHEVRQFDTRWEREASIRLRGGDLAAVAAYDRHGRITAADADAAYDRAASIGHPPSPQIQMISVLSSSPSSSIASMTRPTL